MSNNNWIVYSHKSPSNKRYIGITSQKPPEKRWKRGKGYPDNKHLKNAIDKYGWDNFTHEILCEGLDKKSANEMEKYYISLFDARDREFGYNVQLGGEGGSEILPETKIKMSEARKKRWEDIRYRDSAIAKLTSKEYKEESSIRSKKMWENEEFRNKMTKENHWNYGKHLSNETKEKIRKSQIGENNNNYKGKAYTEEIREMARKNSPYNKALICLDTGETFISTTDASRKLNIDSSYIARVCRGELKHAKGLHFKYLEDKQ